MAIASLVVGAHPITAVYSGDTNFSSSTSPVFTQTVNTGAGTATTVALALLPTVLPNTALFRTNLVYAAKVSPNTASGLVVFIDGTTVVGFAPLNGAGVATFTINQLTMGRHSITAAYEGDSTYNSNVSPTVVFYRSPRPH